MRRGEKSMPSPKWGCFLALWLLALPAAPAAAQTERYQRTDNHGDPLPAGALRRLGTVRWRHDGPVRALLFSADGKSVLAGAAGTLSLWDRASGRLRRRLGDRHADRSVALSADGKVFAACGWSGPVRRWDATTGKERRQITFADLKPKKLALSSDGRLLATEWEETGRPNPFLLWDVRTGKQLHRLPFPYPGVYAVAFSPDGRSIAYGGSGADIFLCDTSTGKVRHRLPSNDTFVDAVAFSPDGKTLASVTLGGGVRLWDVASGELRLRWPSKEKIGRTNVLAFSPDGRTLAQGGEGGAVLWEAATGKQLQLLRGQGAIGSLAFAADGKTLACGTLGHDVWLWDVQTGKPLALPLGHHNVVASACFSPDGRTLASAGHDGTVRVWEVATGKELCCARGHNGPVTGAIFAPDGRTLISAGHDRTVRWWQAVTGRELRSRAVEQKEVKLAVSPDGKLLALDPEPQQLHLWEAYTGKEIRVLGKLGGYLANLSFAAGGKVLISTVYWERFAQLWNFPSGTRGLGLEGPPSATGMSRSPPRLAVSTDGRTLATHGRRGEVDLWEIVSARLRRSFRVPCKVAEIMAFVPGDRVLAVAEESGMVHFLGVTTGKEVGQLDVGRFAPVAYPALTFSPDGRLLATAAADTTLLLWPVHVSARPRRP
jgi:WD40 repeat protein